MRNIFSSLNKYLDRQTENFLTEGLTYVLDVLITNETKSAQELLRLISGIDLQLEPSLLTLTTQETIPSGRLDIVIRQAKELILFIEIKHDSDLHLGQLEGYFKELELRESNFKQLVLITRSKHSLMQTGLDRNLFQHICWYQISGCLSGLKVEDKVSQYIIEQFLRFLEEKEMTNEKVEWQYIEGVPALRHLMSMLYTALAEAFPETNLVRNAGWNWIGYIVANKYWVGVRYENPLQISVETAGAKQYIPLSIIDLEKNHFFAFTAGEQLDKMIEFVSGAMKDLVLPTPP